MTRGVLHNTHVENGNVPFVNNFTSDNIGVITEPLSKRRKTKHFYTTISKRDKMKEWNVKKDIQTKDVTLVKRSRKRVLNVEDAYTVMKRGVAYISTL